MSKSVAIFDFDHTLITGDSFFPYLRHAAGTIPVIIALAAAIVALGLKRIGGDKTTETRFFIKDFLIRRLLTGKNTSHLKQAAIKTRQWQTLNPPVLKALQEHQDKGDTIVIASGGLDLYLPELLRDIRYDALICTDIGVENNIVTGVMVNGNCVRLCKADRVGAWLAANGPFERSWAYGNYPHDVPMMQLVKHRIIVS